MRVQAACSCSFGDRAACPLIAPNLLKAEAVQLAIPTGCFDMLTDFSDLLAGSCTEAGADIFFPDDSYLGRPPADCTYLRLDRQLQALTVFKLHSSPAMLWCL